MSLSIYKMKIYPYFNNKTAVNYKDKTIKKDLKNIKIIR